MKIDYAIIGGTGVYDPKMFEDLEKRIVETIYGAIPVQLGRFKGRRIAFVARHGHHHSLPPHAINYRGNIMALKLLGVEKIIATQAVGSLQKDLAPGHLVLLDQFIDFTKGRVQTFYQGGDQKVLHVDMTEPYCPSLGSDILRFCPQDIPLHKKAVYVCTEGPRFETPAEIKMFARWGGDLVGMTSVPEVILAREMGICYAGIAMVTNYAAGLAGNNLTHQEVLDTMSINIEQLQRLIMNVLANLDLTRECHCRYANQEAGSLG